MSQVTEQSVRFQTALASIKLIQASAVLDLTEDDFDFLTSNKVWIRSEERFSRNAETDLVCRLLLEKKKKHERHGHCVGEGSRRRGEDSVDLGVLTGSTVTTSCGIADRQCGDKRA